MRPLAGPAGAGIFLVWVFPEVPRAGRLITVGRVAFVWCATPRDARTNLNDSDAAAWWFVCLYLRRTKRHGVDFKWFHDSTELPASAPRAYSRRFDDKFQYLVAESHVRHHRWKGASRRCSGHGWCQQTPTAAAVTWVLVPWHSPGRARSMAGQIGHPCAVGATGRTPGVNAAL